MNPLLTIFTPTFNRKHTIVRTFDSLTRQTVKSFKWLIVDDGSSDGTRQWVESLGVKTSASDLAFDWMGRPLANHTDDHFFIAVDGLQIEYIYKSNGGLYTGYNVAYALIDTELCVCIDSDDFAAETIVETVYRRWNGRDRSKDYCGIVGLDFNIVDCQPIAGKFREGVSDGYYYEIKNGGDTKEVMRTDLMKAVAPMTGFEGEKDFNPFYMMSQVLDNYPILVENSNFCWVEYQTGKDSMSQSIFQQYKRSPRSYAKYRINEMGLKRNQNFKNRVRLYTHYVSACIFAGDKNWLNNSPQKLMTICFAPLGLLLNLYIRYKNLL